MSTQNRPVDLPDNTQVTGMPLKARRAAQGRAAMNFRKYPSTWAKVASVLASKA